MPETEKYVTPDQMRDVVEKITTLGTAPPDLTAKLDKPTGKSGQLVYNATTNTWEAAGAADLTATETSAGSGLYTLDSTALTATETALGSGFYTL